MALPTWDNQYINGEWVPSSEPGKYINVIDANTAQPCARIPDGTVQDMDAAVNAARAAFPSWSRTPLAERKAAMQRVLENWQKKKPDVSMWLQKELGCTKMFAEKAQIVMADMHIATAINCVDEVKFEDKTAMGTLLLKEPIGVVGCITPWNYPLNQICSKIAPAMIVGCTVILKASSVTPINAILLTEAIHEAGIPKGVFNLVNGSGNRCGEALANHPEVDMIHITGSTRVGKRLTELSVGNLKHVRTELGGKSAALILDDADFKKVIPGFVQQAMQNSGQSCNALSRLVLPKSRYEEGVKIAQGVAEMMAPGRSGDPKAANGPLVSMSQWETVQGYIKKGIDEGARLVTGGLGKPQGLEDGYFAKMTVFADVDNRMTIAQDEIFGPVLCAIPYESVEEGIDIVNDTIYGLNNAVGSASLDRAVAVARQLRSGTVMINSTRMGPDAPFGGYKQSGNAREWGLHGIEEFLLTKSLAGSIKEFPKAKL